jgi:hypothetical protein
MSDILSIARKNNFYAPKWSPVLNAYISSYDPKDEMRYRLYIQAKRVENNKTQNLVNQFIKHQQLAKAYINIYGETMPIIAEFVDCNALVNIFIANASPHEMTDHILGELRHQYSNMTGL